MSKIYVGQSALRINVSTGADLTGNTTTVLSVRQPTNTVAIWTATVSDASTGSLYYDIPTTTTLPVAGEYLVQPIITYSTDTVSYGTTAKLKVAGLYE
jgi:hypothetical protein